MTKLFLILATLFSVSAFALEPDLKANQFSLGVQAGQVGLLQDVSDHAGNALGFGVIGGYSMTDEFHMELSYLQSHHDNLDHKEFSFGVENYFQSYESMFFEGAAGIAFANNDLSILNQHLKDTAFGLYVGGGLDVLTKKRVSFGLQARYYKMFEAKKTATDGNSYAVVQDFYTVLFRIMYTF